MGGLIAAGRLGCLDRLVRRALAIRGAASPSRPVSVAVRRGWRGAGDEDTVADSEPSRGHGAILSSSAGLHASTASQRALAIAPVASPSAGVQRGAGGGQGD